MNTGSDYSGKDGRLTFQWSKNRETTMPILTVTARGQIGSEHELLQSLELADDFQVKRLDNCRVEVIFDRKSKAEREVVKDITSMQKSDLLDEAARLGIDDVDQNTHISTIRKKVGEARAANG